jgi:hypothetical protein
LFNAVIAPISLKTLLAMAPGSVFVGRLSFISGLVPASNRLRPLRKAKAGLRFGMGPKTGQIGIAIDLERSYEVEHKGDR